MTRCLAKGVAIAFLAGAAGCGGHLVSGGTETVPSPVLPSSAAVEAVLQGEIQYANGDFAGASSSFAEACRETRNDPYLEARLADAQARAKSRQKGVSKPELQALKVPSRAERWATKGRAAAAAGKTAEAISSLEAALKEDPGRVDDRLLLIGLLLEDRRTAEAGRHIDSLPAPEDTATAVTARAKLLIQANMFSEARALIYEYWGSKEPSDKTLKCLAAEAERALDRPEAAERLLENGPVLGECAPTLLEPAAEAKPR